MQESFQRYTEARRRYYQRIDEIRAAVDAWLDQHADGEPTLGEIGHLLGLIEERKSILAQLNEIEDSVVDRLIERQRISKPLDSDTKHSDREVVGG
jgi:hypothetical protein